MSVRVRFAPSPTGNLHIGGARTCLYNYLFAKSLKGKLVIRVEDTDIERSKKEYEDSIIDDLSWLGLDYDEGPSRPGNYGPYRQSERLDIYQEQAKVLLEKKYAFHCFCTEKELEKKKEIAISKGEDPHYDGTCLKLSKEDVEHKINSNENYVIRFKVPQKSYSFDDKVRGKVTFPEKMVGDFVLIRSNGLPTYNFCCVVDDWKMEISHVIRAEDHLNNTLRQLMLYEAFDAPLPDFIHVSLLVGHDRQKLSKRHGATSVRQYKNDSYLPQALLNYLCLLGWSHPEEKDIFNASEVIDSFNLNRFTKSAALYDTDKLNWVNGQHLKNLSANKIAETLNVTLHGSYFCNQDDQWKEKFIELFKEKVNLFSEFESCLDAIFKKEYEVNDNLLEVLSWETTPLIINYLREEIDKLIEEGNNFITADQFEKWQTHIKTELKIKGKKLFMGMRGALTGANHGPDLKCLIPLTPLSILKSRLNKSKN